MKIVVFCKMLSALDVSISRQKACNKKIGSSYTTSCQMQMSGWCHNISSYIPHKTFENCEDVKKRYHHYHIFAESLNFLTSCCKADKDEVQNSK